jgi:c(7)-type cytochrome triheme protein
MKAAHAILLAAFLVFAAIGIPQAQIEQAPASQNPAAEAGNGPEQPVPFRHKKHAGELKISCEFCHAPSRSGETLAIPQAAICMSCHQVIAAGNPHIQKLVGYAKDNTLIPWVRVYQLPSFVTFSHKMHLDHGNTCQECHGPVIERDRLFQETDVATMAGCVNCHRAKKASTGCDTCHLPPQ